MELNQPFTVKEIATFFRTTEQQIYKMIRAGGIESVKVGREYRVTLAALDAFLDGK